MDVEVRDSCIAGQGVFALRSFSAGEVVLSWDVSRRVSAQAAALLSDDEKRYLTPLDDRSFIVMQPPACRVNHSCDANTAVRDFRDVALREIRAGEEITSDYAADLSGPGFACRCGSPRCRGWIGPPAEITP